MQVYKFGGASVKNANGVRNLEDIVRGAGNNLMVVVSAMGKTTNALERVLEFLDAGKEEQALAQWVDIIDFHVAIMKELDFNPASISVCKARFRMIPKCHTTRTTTRSFR